MAVICIEWHRGVTNNFRIRTTSYIENKKVIVMSELEMPMEVRRAFELEWARLNEACPQVGQVGTWLRCPGELEVVREY